jgi:hypothetical protein
MSSTRQVLTALKRGGSVETPRNGSYRWLQRVMRRRTAVDSGSNHARVNACSAHLSQIFKGWLTSVDTEGYSSAALITNWTRQRRSARSRRTQKHAPAIDTHLSQRVRLRFSPLGDPLEFPPR